jgi:hypothetical protein|tara:strand:- start:3315 stop:3557 length:243 start_codon:yes stop_codon:yes gene_type:complete
MKIAEKTTAVCTEEVEEKETSVSETPTADVKTFEVPGWVQVVMSLTQGIGLCIGVVLALPFIAISRTIEWYQTHKNKEEK